jgi:hypothetical protein
MISLTPLNGLCNRMQAMDSAVSLCQDTGVPIKIYWVKKPYINCAFSDLFEPIPGVEVIERNMPFAFGMNSMLHIYDSRLYKLLPNWFILNHYNVRTLVDEQFDFKQLKHHNVLMASSARFFPTAKPFAVFTPVKCLQQRIEEETQHFHQHTIGIHIRRTDHRKSIAHSPIELFESAIEKEIVLNPEVNFYLASDCSDTKQQLHTKYGDRIITNFDKSDRRTKEGVQQALVELYALSRTQKIFGSYWSSFSHTAASISGIEEITLCVADTAKVERTTLSFCIACKNRLQQIKQTLPQNLKDNISMKGQVNFVLVDFGSTDGLEEWIIENFAQEIKDGYLKYYYTDELQDWHTSIAKNTAHALSESDILVNLDCDSYTGENGGEFILNNMIKYGIHNTAVHQFDNNFEDGSYGQIALSKQNFIRIRGYDESFESVGYQNEDLLLRLMLMGISYIRTENRKYNQAIGGDKEDILSSMLREKMNRWYHLLSKKNTTSRKAVANMDKQHIGIARNIYKFV